METANTKKKPEMADQTDIRKLGSWEISGWSAVEIWNFRTYLGFFEELGKLRC